jgi:phage-related protein
MDVRFWKAGSGKCVVAEFIKSQDKIAAQRIMKDIDYLEEQGLNLLINPNKMKKLKGYKNLYELRTSFRGIWYRILFGIFKDEAWLVEAFKKKGNNTPQRNIDKAVARISLVKVNI